MEKVTFKVKKRENKKPNQLRREGIVPANIYQANQESLAVQIKPLDFLKIYREVGDTGLIYLQLEGESKDLPVLVDELQRDSVSDSLLHVVFRKVNLKEKIKASVSVELIGEFAVDNSFVVLVQDEVEVEALPTDLPEKFEIDQSVFKAVGDTITLADLKFDREKVSLVLAEEESPEEITLASVQEKREEEVEEAPETELAEPERIGEDKAEGETTAENQDSEKKPE